MNRTPSQRQLTTGIVRGGKKTPPGRHIILITRDPEVRQVNGRREVFISSETDREYIGVRIGSHVERPKFAWMEDAEGSPVS